MKILKQKLLDLNIFEDNEYLDKYIQLIESNKKTKEEKLRTQKHHIIPRCYYKHNNLKVNNSDENLVNLFYKDHALAHYYLALCSKNKYFKYANEYALCHLISYKGFPINDKVFIKSLDKYQIIYESYKLFDSQNQIGKRLSDETKRKISESNKGKKLSEKTKQKMSAANLGKKLSDETKIKLRDANLGKKLSDETKLKISKNGGKNKGKIYVNNGKITKCISVDDLDKYLSLGYCKGRTSDYCIKLSKSKLGHPVSQITKDKIKQKNTGRKLPDEFKKSAKLRMLGKNCGTVWIHNNYRQFRVDINDLDKYLSLGYERGFIHKNKERK